MKQGKNADLGNRLDAAKKFRLLMVHDMSPEIDWAPDVDYPPEPFQLKVELDDTIALIKTKILQHRDMPVNEESMRKLQLVYLGYKLTKDDSSLKTYLTKGLNSDRVAVKKKFKWSYPYIGVMWIAPHGVEPSNDAINKYKLASSNVVRRTQSDICAAYYGTVQTQAEKLANMKASSD